MTNQVENTTFGSRRSRHYRLHPEPVFNHLLLGFLVSLVEEYFKATYVGLLKYSDRRSQVFKRSRQPTPEDWAAVERGAYDG